MQRMHLLGAVPLVGPPGQSTSPTPKNRVASLRQSEMKVTTDLHITNGGLGWQTAGEPMNLKPTCSRLMRIFRLTVYSAQTTVLAAHKQHTPTVQMPPVAQAHPGHSVFLITGSYAPLPHHHHHTSTSGAAAQEAASLVPHLCTAEPCSCPLCHLRVAVVQELPQQLAPHRLVTRSLQQQQQSNQVDTAKNLHTNNGQLQLVVALC